MGDTLKKTPMESLGKDMTYLYEKGTNNQTLSRHQSRSRDQSPMRSRSTSSDKIIDDRDRDQL
jgi:hypothetical protein